MTEVFQLLAHTQPVRCRDVSRDGLHAGQFGDRIGIADRQGKIAAAARAHPARRTAAGKQHKQVAPIAAMVA